MPAHRAGEPRAARPPIEGSGLSCSADSSRGENGRVARLLCLGAGPAQLGVLAAARAADLTVIAADRDPSAPGFRYADRRAIVSTQDEPPPSRPARPGPLHRIRAPRPPPA